MERRRILMQSQVLPPTGYKFIEYARSDIHISRGVRIILPYGFYKTDTLETYAAIDDVTGNDEFLFASGRWNNDNNRFAFVGGYRANAFGVGYGSVSTAVTSFKPDYRDELFHKWVYKDYTFSITDINYNKNVLDITFGTETNNIQMFYGYSANTSGKIAYFKQTKADGRKLYLLPIQNKTTGDVEMYDIVSKTIMPRAGTLYAPEE